VLVTPGEQLICRTLTIGKIGKVGSAVSQGRGGLSGFALQYGKWDGLVSDNDAKPRIRRVGDGKADQFHGGILRKIMNIYLSTIKNKSKRQRTGSLSIMSC
jgi:hypothetical protein